MNEAADNRASKRGFAARAGITALNLIAPGLGLLRVGDWRAGAIFLLLPFVLLVLGTFAIGHVSITSYAHALYGLCAVLALTVIQYLAPAVLTWRRSRFRAALGRWSRWYSLTAIAIVDLILLQGALSLARGFYKPLYAAAESMAPTIGRGDKFFVDTRWRGPLRRGAIIIFNGPENVRISRIAAIAGDRIAMRDGVPIVNGTPAIQRRQGTTIFTVYDGQNRATQLEERLPGEASTHRILDIGSYEFDDMPEVVVPANHVFVLGDNRDQSADSRVPLKLGGVAMVPVSALIGRPMYIHWSQDRGTIGTRLDK